MARFAGRWIGRAIPGMLLGREAELARIDGLLDDAREGGGTALVIRGEPGIGKSALLRYAQERASGLRVLGARGVEAESELPFAALATLLGPVLGHLERVPTPQREALEGALAIGAGAPRDRFAAAIATLSLLAAAAERSPLLLLVDDAHCLDASSVEALAFCARRLGNDPMALLLAAREEGSAAFEAAGLPQLRLAGLEPGVCEALLRERAERPVSHAVAVRLAQATGGNPLALLELPRLLSEAQLAGTEPVDDPLPVGPSIEHALARRVASLPEVTRRALTVVAASDSGRWARSAPRCGRWAFSRPRSPMPSGWA